MKSFLPALLLVALLLGLGVAAPPASAFDPCGTARCTAWQPGACVGASQGACDADDVACVTNAGQALACAEIHCQCRPIESNQVWVCTAGHAPCGPFDVVCVGNGGRTLECVTVICACMPAAALVDPRVPLSL